MATAAALGGEEALRYSRVAMWLHWLIALAVAVNLFLGFFHEDFERPTRAAMMWYHKATGLTVLALTLVRIGWRLGHRPPPFDPDLRSRNSSALGHPNDLCVDAEPHRTNRALRL